MLEAARATDETRAIDTQNIVPADRMSIDIDRRGQLQT
jgi:hypothetical protein